MENEKLEKLKIKVLEEELEFWKMKYEGAVFETHYWKAKAMKEGVRYEGNTVSYPIER